MIKICSFAIRPADAAEVPNLRQHQSTLLTNPASTDGRIPAAATLMKDLMEKRLASMVESP